MKTVEIVCIDDRFSKMLRLNQKYIATKQGDCYIININDNHLKRTNARYRRNNLKLKTKYFIEI